MELQLTPKDADKLLELQEKCDVCKDVIIHEEKAGSVLQMRSVCEQCKKVRVRLPELMELKRKMMALNAAE